MQCLWVSGDVPHPPAYGKLIYSAGLSEALATAGVDVYGLGLMAAGVAVPSTAASWNPVRAERVPRSASLRSMLPSMTVATTSLSDAFTRLLEERPWDVIVVDHLETGWVADVVSRSGPPIVYIAHNHESSVRNEVARRRGTRVDRRLALHVDAIKARRLERRLVERAALVVAITDHDACRFASDDPTTPVLVLTPGYDGPRRTERTIDASTPRRAAIVTSLDWHVKQANLASFVAIADPVLAKAGVQLAVAGSAPEPFATQITRNSRATTMLGRVDALDELMDETRVGIVAEPLGGGFKLKVLDYVFGRVPVASLAGSVEGIPLREGTDHLVFGDAATLAEGVVRTIDDYPLLNGLQHRAFDRCATGYDWHERGEKLANALVNIAGGRP
jgi:glycosyltransferase involved in cell wall biosynthesis